MESSSPRWYAERCAHQTVQAPVIESEVAIVTAPWCPPHSLDGYIEDREGSFDWAAPDCEVHAFANDLEAGVVRRLSGSASRTAAGVGATASDGTIRWPSEEVQREKGPPSAH